MLLLPLPHLLLPHHPLLSLLLLAVSLLHPHVHALTASPLPLVVNTWGGPFTLATDAAYLVLANNNNNTSPFHSQSTIPPSSSSSSSSFLALDAVHSGCTACETARCDRSVGFGGSPDENCETTLDALIIDGSTLNVGAVAGLRRIRHPISVARHVLEYTSHSLLAGDLATQYALQHGFVQEDLSTDESTAECHAWRRRGCVPNFRTGTVPDPVRACQLRHDNHASSSSSSSSSSYSTSSHDTLSLIAIDIHGNIAAGSTTNGATHKIPGRIGDAPIPGSAAYADNHAGACAATGDGDIMMRFLPCYHAVESMRQGISPARAAADAVRRIATRYPGVSAGLVVVNTAGEHAGAACGWKGEGFRYAWRGGGMESAEVVRVEALDRARDEL